MRQQRTVDANELGETVRAMIRDENRGSKRNRESVIRDRIPSLCWHIGLPGGGVLKLHLPAGFVWPAAFAHSTVGLGTPLVGHSVRTDCPSVEEIR